jgi:hypothetical protein
MIPASPIAICTLATGQGQTHLGSVDRVQAGSDLYDLRLIMAQCGVLEATIEANGI